MHAEHNNTAFIIEYLSGVCALSSSRDIARYRLNSPIYAAHKSTSVVCGKKHEIFYISRTTQRTNSGQVPACSQEPVDSTDANMVETSTCLETTQQEMTNFTVRYRSNRTGPCSAAPLSVQSSYRYQNILRIGEVLGHRIDAKISPKAGSEKAQTTVSENTYTFPNIDVFRTAI